MTQSDATIAFVRAQSRTLSRTNSKRWIACPSVSADPARHPEVRRSAQAVVARMRAAGLMEAGVLETGGLPVAYGEWLGAPGAPTVLIYGHHDVQPEDPSRCGHRRRSKARCATASCTAAAPSTIKVKC